MAAVDMARRQSPALWHWAAGGLGIALGLYVLIALSLEPKWAFLLIAAALCPLLAMITGQVRKVLLAIIALDTFLNLDINLFYQSDISALFGLGGLSLSLTTLCLAFLYAQWLADLLLGRARLPGHLFSSSLPLGAYLLVCVLSLGVARRVDLSLFQIALLLQTFLLYVYVAATIRSRQEVLFITLVLLAGLGLEGLVMAGGWVEGENLEFAGLKVRTASGRTGGTLWGPTEAAGALLLLLAPAASVLLTRVRRACKGLAACAFALGSLGLVLTFSRGGWIGAALSGSILFLAGWRRRWLRPVYPMVLAAVILATVLAFRERIEARIFGDDIGSADSRIPLMEFASEIIADHPWLGVGVNNYADWMIPRALEDGWTWVAVVHNKYLLVWAETGIFGLAAFLWFLLATLRHGWVCWKLGDRFLAPLAIGFTAAIAGQMVHMFVDIYASRPLVQGLWLVAGLLAAMRELVETPVRAAA